MLTRPWPIWCQFGPTCFWLALDLPQLKSVHFNSFISYHLPILLHLWGEQASHMMPIQSNLFLIRPWLGPDSSQYILVHLWQLTNLIEFARWAGLTYDFNSVRFVPDSPLTWPDSSRYILIHLSLITYQS